LSNQQNKFPTPVKVRHYCVLKLQPVDNPSWTLKAHILPHALKVTLELRGSWIVHIRSDTRRSVGEYQRVW